MNRREFLGRSLAGSVLAVTGASFGRKCVGAPSIPQIASSSRSVAPNHYTRIFPDLASNLTTRFSDPATEQWLVKLGKNMKEDPDARPNQQHPPPMAGYTYLGQFIVHDLTFDLTPIDQAHPDPARMSNLRTPFLDLDHLYGGGPNVSPFLYDRQSRHGAEKFLIGQTAPVTVDGREFRSTLDDLPRNAQGLALVPDPRQDENLIIAQLHVAFLKLHNRIIDGLKSSEIPVGPGPLFDQARQLLTWHYQWIVHHDYLRAIIDPPVFDSVVATAVRTVSKQPDFQIPLEYALAGGRFGHSMVRDQYFINDLHAEAGLREDLVRLTGVFGGIQTTLPADWVISWERFFYVGSAKFMARRARAIDTRVAPGLFEPDHPGAPPLPTKTLLRGHRAGLPSGQELAKAFGLEPLDSVEIADGPDHEILVEAGFDRKTPLWYYVLKEAQVAAHGAHLGRLGSELVGNTIMSALIKDPGSYLSIEPNWVPTLPGPVNPEQFGMADLLRCIYRPIN